ncbi:MAG: thermonuclease family protein [Bacteriovoracaceae bacterium]
MKQYDLRAVKILCIGLLPLFLFFPTSGIKTIRAKCERVIDGDTVEARYGSRLLKLRLAFIDAPEIKQLSLDKVPIGLRSQQFLQDLALGKELVIKVLQKDRYGRYLAEIYLGKTSLNLTMVESGQAVIYRYYEFQTVQQKVEYMRGEAMAKRKRLGMWKTFGFYDPHAYRRLKRRSNAKQ